MGTFVWLALAFLLVTVIVGPIFAIRHGIRTFKQAMHMLESLGEGVGDALGKLDAAPGHMDAAAASAERLADALDRLHRSRARLAILLAALAEVRAGVTGTLGVIPRR